MKIEKRTEFSIFHLRPFHLAFLQKKALNKRHKKSHKRIQKSSVQKILLAYIDQQFHRS